jgi:oxaloacetate decarboxylase beta subunit
MLGAIERFLSSTGIAQFDWRNLIMMIIACVLLYLAIGRKFEPLLLIPIAMGMLLSNLFGSTIFDEGGLLYYFYTLNKWGILPPLIFMGVGAMTDFGPLIANPKSLLLGAAAQLGIFITFIGAILLGFTAQEAGSIGIIGGADGPTAILVTTLMAPHRLGAIAIAADAYMALVPVIQPPIMKLLTTKSERQIVMKQLRVVSKKEKILFPIIVTIIVAVILPDALPLIGMLMLGNLFRESGLTDRLSDTAQNALVNTVTIFLGLSVGASAVADQFSYS